MTLIYKTYKSEHNSFPTFLITACPLNIALAWLFLHALNVWLIVMFINLFKNDINSDNTLFLSIIGIIYEVLI